MKQKYKSKLSGSVAVLFSLTILFTSILPLIIGSGSVYAGTVTNRSITMGQSEPGATTSYTINWTPNSTTSIDQVVIAFCSNSPILTDTTCTTPTGFTVTTTPSASESGGLTPVSGCSWTAANAGSGDVNTLELSYSGSSCTSLAQSTSTADNIVLSNVTNPTPTCSSASACAFYARITTYSAATTWSAGSLTGVVDYGGVALSTASQIQINATVEEQLQFCVYVSSCGTTPVTLTMGHLVGGNTVIDSQGIYTSPVSFSLSTNAYHGASVSLLGGTLTDPAGQTIPAAGTTTASAIVAGTAGFGVYVSTLGGGMSVVSPYTGTDTACSSSQCYDLDSTSSTSTPIAQSSAPVNNSISTMTYGVTASPTTAAGVYSATHQLIATGTF